MSTELILVGVSAGAAFTGLVTEAVKKILDECGRTYMSNLLAGIVSIIISLGIGICYVLYTGTDWTVQVTVSMIIMVFLTWLCAMMGYDKVIQTLSQIGGASDD